MLEDLPLHGNIADGIAIPAFDIEDIKAGDLDLQEQLLIQYNSARRLYASIEHEDEVPANQKAQVLNALTSILVQITKSQEAVHNMQTLKRLEEALIVTLRTLPKDAQNTFYEAYEANNARASF